MTMHMFPGFHKHLRLFLLMVETIFTLVFLSQIIILVFELSLTLGEVVLPSLVSWLLIFISLAMVTMAGYYRMTLRMVTLSEDVLKR